MCGKGISCFSAAKGGYRTICTIAYNICTTTETIAIRSCCSFQYWGRWSFWRCKRVSKTNLINSLIFLFSHQVLKKHLWKFSTESLIQASQPNPLLRRRTLGTPSLWSGFPHVSRFFQGQRYSMEPDRTSAVHWILLPPLPHDEQRYNNRYRYNRRRRSDGVSTIATILRGWHQGGGIIVLPIQGLYTGWGIQVTSPLRHGRKHDSGSIHLRQQLWRTIGVPNRNEQFIWTIHRFHVLKVPQGQRHWRQAK